MSHDDFCKCTFGEFESICEAWREMRENNIREEWERSRTIAAILLQPHVKKGTKITPRRLISLPWDKQITPPNEVPELTAEEKRERYEEVARRLIGDINS